MKIINISGSKSIIQRLLIIASYMENDIFAENWSNCSDVKTMENAVRKIGLKIKHLKTGAVISHQKDDLKDNTDFFINDSATATRFLLSRLSTIKNHFTLNISEQLAKRPHKNIVEIINKNGAKIIQDKNHFEIYGEKYLNGGIFKIDSSISSQFISSLLLIAPSYKNDLELHLTKDIVSKNYMEMTISIMNKFGIKVVFKDNKILLKKGQKYKKVSKFYVEPDFSSLAYFFVLSALKFKKGILIKKMATIPIQGDYAIIEILKKMNGNFIETEDYCGFAKSSLRGINIDMKNYPDLVPILTIAALFAEGNSVFKNVDHLKYKESNRINSLITELPKIGAEIRYSEKSLIINPKKKYFPAFLETYKDHRIAMAFMILKQIVPEIELSETESVKKSFPEFFNILNSLNQ